MQAKSELQVGPKLLSYSWAGTMLDIEFAALPKENPLSFKFGSRSYAPLPTLRSVN